MSNILDRRHVRGSMLAVDNLYGTAFTGEENAHVFRITDYEGSAAVAFTGEIAGKFINPAGVTVPLSGSLDGDGRAVVTLDEHCYAVEGRFILTIWAGSEVIYCGVGQVMNSQTDTIDYPTAGIPDVAALIQQLQTILNNWPADYSQLQSDVSNLKSAITANTGTEILPVTETGKYIEIVTNTAVTKTSANFKYTKYACSAGDVFTVNAVGAGGAIAYGFIDASDGVLSKASQNTEYHDTVITAPANSAYLIVNNRVTNDYISYKGIPLIQQIAPVFSASANYPANAVVIYGGKLYQFNARHAAGAWTGSDVTEKTIADLLLAEFSNKDILPNGTDADTVLKTGFWNLSSSSSYSYTNIPVSHINTRIVLICMTTMPVASGNVAQAFQMLVDITHNNVYQRIYNSTVGWSSWQILNSPSAYEIAKNPVFTTISHGGFFTRTQEDQHYQQDSPLAFKRAAQAGIYNHEVDIAFSSDGVPLVAHSNMFTDTNGVSHTIYLETAAQLQAVQRGDSSYSWTIMTLAQADAYIKKLGGRIYMVDVSAPRGDYDTFSTNNATALPGYYRANNINPVWTNWDAQLHLNAFVAAGAEFGVAFVCETETSISTALTYMASNPNIKYALYLWLTTGGIAPATAKTYVTQIREAGAAIIAYLYSASTLSDVPMWADGVLSEDTNISYKLFEAEMYG